MTAATVANVMSDGLTNGPKVALKRHRRFQKVEGVSWQSPANPRHSWLPDLGSNQGPTDLDVGRDPDAIAARLLGAAGAVALELVRRPRDHRVAGPNLERSVEIERAASNRADCSPVRPHFVFAAASARTSPRLIRLTLRRCSAN
jgi:hypothetical protein